MVPSRPAEALEPVIVPQMVHKKELHRVVQRENAVEDAALIVSSRLESHIMCILLRLESTREFVELYSRAKRAGRGGEECL